MNFEEVVHIELNTTVMTHHSQTQPTNYLKNCSEHCYHGNEPINKFDLEERIQLAKQTCQQKGVRFTQLRQTVYRLILASKHPIGAYDLLSLMQQEESQKNTHASSSCNHQNACKSSIINTTQPKRKNIAPPTVYRSLNFLLEVGLIHQLKSINAYIPCHHPDNQHIATFLICEQCQQVQECHSNVLNHLLEHSRQLGFTAKHTMVEIQGICQNCL